MEIPTQLGSHVDPRMTDPRWQDVEPWDLWSPYEDGWMQMDIWVGTYRVRAGANEDPYEATDAVDAICQAMVKYPDEDDFEIESVNKAR